MSFTDASTNTPTSWSWSFPGGTPSSSTSQNPTITYNTAGTYAVTLTATNAFGSDPETKTGYITVNSCGSTSLKPAYAKTYVSYAEKVACYPVVNAQEYEFEFTPVGGGAPIIYNRGIANQSLLLGWATGLVDGTTYNVRVRAKIGGSFGAFGVTRQLTTPSATQSTSLVSLYCNKVYTSYNELINCYTVNAATNYEFEFTPSGGGAPINYVTGGPNSIFLSQVTGLANGTVYDVRVRSFVGSWGAYGTICQITTPSSSATTTVKSHFCGAVFTTMSDKIACYSVANATDYE